jgi:hypothetical protein
MHTRLAAVSETLRQLLEDAMLSDTGTGGLATFFGSGGTGLVSLANPEEMGADTEGLSLWLYRVARDEQRLNEPPTMRPIGGGRVELVPPPLPLRLHYLVTPLAKDAPDTEQKILGRVLQALHSRPIVAGAALRGDLTGSDAELHVHLEALSLDDVARVWEAMQASYQLSVSYEVTLAHIESQARPERSSLVESLRAEHAVIVGS